MDYEQRKAFNEIIARIQSAVTPNELRNTVIRLVEANPDFVYSDADESGTCFYERNGKPSCIIGKALAKHGISFSTLRDLDSAPIATSVGELFMNHPDRENVMWLQVVQEYQDQLYPWGECVRIANQHEEIRRG